MTQLFRGKYTQNTEKAHYSVTGNLPEISHWICQWLSLPIKLLSDLTRSFHISLFSLAKRKAIQHRSHRQQRKA